MSRIYRSGEISVRPAPTSTAYHAGRGWHSAEYCALSPPSGAGGRRAARLLSIASAFTAAKHLPARVHDERCRQCATASYQTGV
ncbi:hypothetical protein KCP78_05530 [Salmonella enterica subsp. enterica]|nr:hypothetical protein KCP78_05530 [Salmonella enterica subsp. enterica]